MKKFFLLATSCCLLFAFGVQAQQKIDVNASAREDNDDSVRAGTFKSLQPGINAHSAGDSILAAGGICRVSAPGQGFERKEEVKIYGGFAETEGSLSRWDPGKADTNFVIGTI